VILLVYIFQLEDKSGFFCTGRQRSADRVWEQERPEVACCSRTFRSNPETKRRSELLNRLDFSPFEKNTSWKLWAKRQPPVRVL
jgi:hypothetical protein